MHILTNRRVVDDPITRVCMWSCGIVKSRDILYTLNMSNGKIKSSMARHSWMWWWWIVRAAGLQVRWRLNVWEIWNRHEDSTYIPVWHVLTYIDYRQVCTCSYSICSGLVYVTQSWIHWVECLRLTAILTYISKLEGMYISLEQLQKSTYNKHTTPGSRVYFQTDR